MEKLANYIARKGLKQADFAEQIGANQSTVHRLIKGEIRDPVISLVLAIKKATKGEIRPEDWK